ncbi:MAG: hypothetical protein AB7F86_20295 [Bdellovibrionales bacterium]
MGLVTRLAALGSVITMAAACMHLFAMGDPMIATGQGGSAEPALVYLFISILYLLHGPGRHSVDKMLFGASK